ncbi:GNAT family N-acetyltransferase [Fructilactobacillus fructivorans]|uniref:Putative acetyltransferase n=1 Tax=Fructilactobacillus fructivorans TaxID=1614 RepID=A0A0C1LZE3_9LACO|nr:GNAT family N-acetyltransferase [Fructilactobacillus fructivorans]KID42230.1 putative acetyltransferase [Fructilactobacillus fructivorans]MCT0151144.1 N-acetyltransferase [Fructilactobacillus fructivorans]MCT2867298.1 N-acetyltransferase [Fructilactobacillus fructivorans]MCT2869182.1 N-acetyltransferase [Fructilactobacillus fructivorans]MCT2873097.1 N-acetyltransferase [Fructilactobacillus fructivorans]
MKFDYEPGRFYANDVHGNLIAEVTFTEDNGVVSINETFVNPNYRGQGLAGKLIMVMIDYAKKNHYQIKPVCSFAVKFFEKNTQYDDLLVGGK